MIRFLLAVGIAAGVGGAAAWKMNHDRYGYREARFGPFDTEQKVTVENLNQHMTLEAEGTDTYGVVEMLDEIKHDFGVMAPGTEGEHSFRIKNAGEGDLNLRLGATTCKCTLGDLEKSVLPPGEETEITLTWSVKANSREFSQTAQLLTTDPKTPAVTLSIFGRVISDFEVVPETWTFDDVATGEPFQIKGEIYNYSGKPIEPGDLKFTSNAMNKLAEFDVQRIEKEDLGEKRSGAIEGFRVTAKVAAGMPQAAVSQNLIFDLGNYAGKPSPDSTDGDTNDSDDQDKKSNGLAVIYVPVQGRVVGSLTMIESSKLRKREDGGYMYSFGRISKDGSFSAKTFVVLKGNERENTTLSIGKTAPKGVVEATLGKAKSRGSMVLYPLTIKLIPGDKPIERLGKSKDDYGRVWIESDNPKVTKMGVVLTFGLPAR